MKFSEIHSIQPSCVLIEDGKALKKEFERSALCHLSRLFKEALYLTKDKSEAEDLVQETYLRAFRFFNRFEPGTNCKAWLLSILRRLFITRYRQLKNDPEMVDWERIDQVYESMVEQGQKINNNPEEIFFSKHLDHEVEMALGELPEKYRSAIVLTGIEELTYDEAAKIMGCPLGTVRSRVSRGRRILQVSLREYALRREYLN